MWPLKQSNKQVFWRSNSLSLCTRITLLCQDENQCRVLHNDCWMGLGRERRRWCMRYMSFCVWWLLSQLQTAWWWLSTHLGRVQPCFPSTLYTDLVPEFDKRRELPNGSKTMANCQSTFRMIAHLGTTHTHTFIHTHCYNYRIQSYTSMQIKYINDLWIVFLLYI